MAALGFSHTLLLLSQSNSKQKTKDKNKQTKISYYYNKPLVFWPTLFPLKIISFSTTNNIWGMGIRGRRLFIPADAKLTDILEVEYLDKTS